MDTKNSNTQNSEKSEKVFKLNPENIYYFNYWMYVGTGFWTYKSSTPWKRRLYNAYQRFLIAMYCLIIAFFIIDAIVVRHDLEKLSFNLSSSVLVFLTIMKAVLLIKKIDVVEDIMEKVESTLQVQKINNPEAKKISQHWATILYNITRFFYILLIIAYPMRIIADTALTKYYLIPLPFRHKFEDYFLYVYLVEAVIGSHFMVSVISHDMFVYGIIIQLVEHLDILEENIFKIKDYYPSRNFQEFIPGYKDNEEKKVNFENVLIINANNAKEIKKFSKTYNLNSFGIAPWIENKKLREEKTHKLLKEIINYHQKILGGIKRLSEMYSLPLLVQTWGFVTLISIAILQVIILSRKITPLLVQQALYVGTSTTNLLSLCTFGSELSNKSWASAEALYDTPWYEMDERNKHTILYVLQKLIIAPRLKGGGIFNINRVTFLKFMQTSYNVVAVLRNVY